MSEESSRRMFLGRTISRRVVLGATPAAAGAVIVAGCSAPGTGGAAAPPSPTAPDDVEAPYRPPFAPSTPPEEFVFFTPEEAQTVEAITARIMPGTDDDPGAVQAGVPYYIDGKLSQFEDHAEPTFTHGPYAQSYSGDEPPAPVEGIVWVHEDHLYRYGFQSALTPQQLYRQGLAALDEYSEERFGGPFADLTEEEQDDILLALDGVGAREESGPEENGENGDDDESDAGTQEADDGGGNGGDDGEEEEVSDALLDQAEEAFGNLSPGLFFSTVRQDTIDGMFSDPSYGGNRDMVGWLLIGHPGSQRSYSPAEMLNGTDKQPQPMHLLTPMNPDRAGGGRPALEQHAQQKGA